MDDPRKTLCLIDELETSYKLITIGFGELQEIRMDNDFYHLPQQLLASGFERLMKCYFCLVYEARNKSYPDTKFLTELGHSLERLKQSLIDEYFKTNEIPLLIDDLEFLKTDVLLGKIINILSEFGKKARYYNLDIVTGNQKVSIDPNKHWAALEKEIEDPVPYLTESQETLYRDYYPKVNAIIISRLERLFRAIAMQFTLGQHGGRLRQMSTVIGNFYSLKNNEFGNIDYRRSVKQMRASYDSWHKRDKKDVLKSRWPSRVINRQQFEGDWPFRSDEVVIENRERIFYIVNIEGYDFALNGSARSKYNLPNPHDMDIAILGKSLGPFFDIAVTLSSK